MDFETILDGLGLLLFVVIVIAAFISKTIVWRPPIQNKPEKITWFGRVFMLLAGSVGVVQFGTAILKRRGVLISATLSNWELQMSKVILEFLFLAIVTPFLIMTIRQLIRREDPNKVNQLLTVFLALVGAYLLWNVIPDMARTVSSVLH